MKVAHDVSSNFWLDRGQGCKGDESAEFTHQAAEGQQAHHAVCESTLRGPDIDCVISGDDSYRQIEQKNFSHDEQQNKSSKFWVT